MASYAYNASHGSINSPGRYCSALYCKNYIGSDCEMLISVVRQHNKTENAVAHMGAYDSCLRLVQQVYN